MKLVTMEDWLAKAHPDAPALPWTAESGEEICSFMLTVVDPSTGGVIPRFFDAHGREVEIEEAAWTAAAETCQALASTTRVLTFLPVAIMR
jgi:hypothetical protein